MPNDTKIDFNISLIWVSMIMAPVLLNTNKGESGEHFLVLSNSYTALTGHSKGLLSLGSWIKCKFFLFWLVFDHLILIWRPGCLNTISFLKRCLVQSNAALEWGAMLDIRRKPKKAVRNIALNKGESKHSSQSSEIFPMVGISNTPFSVGGVGLLIRILLKNKKIC